jgi:hypothetical protein
VMYRDEKKRVRCLWKSKMRHAGEWEREKRELTRMKFASHGAKVPCEGAMPPRPIRASMSTFYRRVEFVGTVLQIHSRYRGQIACFGSRRTGEGDAKEPCPRLLREHGTRKFKPACAKCAQRHAESLDLRRPYGPRRFVSMFSHRLRAGLSCAAPTGLGLRRWQSCESCVTRR